MKEFPFLKQNCAVPDIPILTQRDIPHYRGIFPNVHCHNSCFFPDKDTPMVSNPRRFVNRGNSSLTPSKTYHIMCFTTKISG